MQDRKRLVGYVIEELKERRAAKGFFGRIDVHAEVFVIRLFRIFIGLVLVVIGMASCGKAVSIANTPLASLSLADISGLFLLSIIVFYLFKYSFVVAFSKIDSNKLEMELLSVDAERELDRLLPIMEQQEKERKP